MITGQVRILITLVLVATLALVLMLSSERTISRTDVQQPTSSQSILTVPVDMNSLTIEQLTQMRNQMDAHIRLRQSARG